MTGGLLAEAFVYLAAAVVTVPLAKRLGLGSVLGYLLAGVAIGPFGLGLLADGEGALHFGEFGVVMMLFVVGLELEPKLLWRLRGSILGLGGLQVIATAAAVTGIALALGIRWNAAVAIGLTLAMSSTAIVLQTLSEKGLLKGPGGQGAFSVLLFQDIAVIPILAVFPLLAREGKGGVATSADAAHGTTLVAGLPGWAQTLAVLGAVALVVVGGRLLVRPLFHALARTNLREIFTAAVLALVVGIALLMTQVGLSPALGTFLAGVVLATSEYRHELESDIEPFKGLLLGLFFIAVGAQVDFAMVGDAPGRIAAMVAGIVALKLVVLAVLGRAFRMRWDQALLLAFALPQVGEFAFVLLSFGAQSGVLTDAESRPLVAAVALSMALTPLLLLLYERVLAPRLTGAGVPSREADAIAERHPVLIAGFGVFGSTLGRLLRANGVPTTVLDIDSDRVALMRELGLTAYYGDATRPDLLHAAGAERASLLVIALDEPEKTLQLARLARRHYPHLQILARARDWSDAHDLLAEGVEHVYRASLDTALRAGADALHLLGFRAHQAHRAARKFLRHDEESLRELLAGREDRARYLSAARERIAELERMLRADLEDRDVLARDLGWDPETLREDANTGDPVAWRTGVGGRGAE